MKQFHILLILTALMIIVTGSVADAVSNAGVLYLRVAPGARPAGMGEAFVSIADDATATYWNPAGLGNAPISGKLKTMGLPDELGSTAGLPVIQDVVTLSNIDGSVETWIISGNNLFMYDGESWDYGKDYETTSDQTLETFLQTIIAINNDDQLAAMEKTVIDVNCQITPEELDAFITAINENTPEGYSGLSDLKDGLDKMKVGYVGCLLKPEIYTELKKRLDEGLKDGTMTSEELDKITYTLDRAVSRYLPQRLKVPYSAGIAANLQCLGKSGNYLWVGTDNGVYRLAGKAWARYSVDNNLPSDNILTMANYDEYLMIGTEAGIVRYYHGEFTNFDNLPPQPVSVINFVASDVAYAIINGVVYYYNGQDWSDSYGYAVRIDDTMEKLVARTAVYHTPEEYQYLERRLRELNGRLVPQSESKEEAAVSDDMSLSEMVKANKSLEATGEAVETPAEGTDAADSTESDEALTATDEAAATELPGEEVEFLPDNSWLVEGNMIRLPYSPPIRFQVNDVARDLKGVLWVGTTGGLLSFDGKTWTRHGYVKYEVPSTPGDDGEAPDAMSTMDIARVFLPGGDSTRVTLLAQNIDEYNELNGQMVQPGGAVYVYNSNLGSEIHSIGLVYGELYVGTDYGMEKRTGNNWEEVKGNDLDHRLAVAAYDFENQAFYVSQDGITTETKGQRELILMHAKWLPNLNLDMYYEFASYVQHIRGVGTIGASVIFLTYGSIEFTDEQGNSIGEGNPFELTVALSYGTSLTRNLKWGITGKYIHSRLSDQGVGAEKGEGIANDFAVDLGILYMITDRLTFGSALTNIGPDIKYVDAAQSDPLPLNLGVGMSYKVLNSHYNKLIVQAEVNKLLTNLDRGFGKELELAIRHFGAEYWYANLIALRGGYKYDKDGQVKHFTFGSGLKWGGARLDFAYIPSSTDSPLANTLRISFTLNF